MPQIFPESANVLARSTVIIVAGGVALGIGIAYAINDSGYMTRVDVARDQPVPFSHKHHVGGLGLDCRYCHTFVEESSSAGIPPIHTCMTCHSQIWLESPMLEPIRKAYRDNHSIEWNRVHDLPDFVYFDHSIHVHKGMGCTTCHGQVDQMPLTWSVSTLQMKWCLDCHREPWKYVRPREEVFSVTYKPPANQRELGMKLAKEYEINSMDSCYTCHR